MKLGMVFALLTTILAALSISSSPERNSPSNWVKQEQIKVFQDKVLLDIPGVSWTTFADTNSMDPFLDADANALEILPDNPDDINVGDVISYRASSGVVIHRVTKKGYDDEGLYYTVKGDNNTLRDPYKVRYEDVEGVLVAIIY